MRIGQPEKYSMVLGNISCEKNQANYTNIFLMLVNKNTEHIVIFQEVIFLPKNE